MLSHRTVENHVQNTLAKLQLHNRAQLVRYAVEQGLDRDAATGSDAHGPAALRASAAGLVGSVAGLASLISYPALLAVGLPPVAANVTNTVSLVFSGVGSASARGVELAGQGAACARWPRRPLVGGAAGGGLLLLTPPGAFEAVVPVLIGAGERARAGRAAPTELAAAHPDGRAAGCRRHLRRRGLRRLLRRRRRRDDPRAPAAGTQDTTVRAIAAKNALLGLANGVAAVGFVLLGPVRWGAVLPLALGSFAGGRLGPAVARRLPRERCGSPSGSRGWDWPRRWRGTRTRDVCPWAAGGGRGRVTAGPRGLGAGLGARASGLGPRARASGLGPRALGPRASGLGPRG